MPPLPGEERLLTLYADVHYYFAKPTARPVQHRFDKGSYFYVYYNSTHQTSRLEIANNPGTEFQDAFNGYLDRCRIRNTYTFPTRLTLEVEAEGLDVTPSSPTSRDDEEWRLELADPKSKDGEKHKLHTLDIYLWTQEDAKLAVEYFKKLLEPSQLDITELPAAKAAAQQRENESPVVQNLEKIAKSDPAYSNGQTRNSQNQPQSQTINLPPPPPAPQSDRGRKRRSTHDQTTVSKSRSEDSSSPDSQTSSAKFVPVAYNPAAPAAPEPRAHREKTPPPEDDNEGTGLRGAVAHDHGYNQGRNSAQPYQNMSPVQPQHAHYGSPPPRSATSGYGSPAPPRTKSSNESQPSGKYSIPLPPPPPLNKGRSSDNRVAPSFAAPPPSTTPSQSRQQSSTGYGSPSPEHSETGSSRTSTALTVGRPNSSALSEQDPHRHSYAAEHYTPSHSDYQHDEQPVVTPGTEFYRTLEQPARPLQHIRPQYPDVLADRTSPAPPGPAYNQHIQGGQRPPSNRQDHDPYAIHNQVYRPTEQEKHSHGHSHKKDSRKDSKEKQSTTDRIEERADKLKGKFMKRFG